MRDFTLNTFGLLLTSLKARNYTFQTFAEFLKNPATKSIILRHDVDGRKMNSLTTARMEEKLGITGTYYFRMVPESFDENVIKQIAELGHEIGYHYEDVSMAAGGRRKVVGFEQLTINLITARLQDRKTARPQDKALIEEELAARAIERFKENLAKLRRVAPVETICMHGSPLSKYDNRKLWEKYNYRDYGITGEPYFDVNFEEVLYLTDTGRRWDGDSVNIRDKTINRIEVAKNTKEEASRYEVHSMGYKENQYLNKEQTAKSNQQPVTLPKLNSTFDIIRTTESGLLSDHIMITVHPQRWDNRPLPWIKELVWQNIKNIGKCIITSSTVKK